MPWSRWWASYCCWSRPGRDGARDSASMTDPGVLTELLWWLLGAFVLPLWLLSGFTDYICHARTDIAHTSGAHESLLHLLQTVEIGLPLLAFLFFSVDALLLVLMLAGVMAHTASSWSDL